MDAKYLSIIPIVVLLGSTAWVCFYVNRPKNDGERVKEIKGEINKIRQSIDELISKLEAEKE